MKRIYIVAALLLSLLLLCACTPAQPEPTPDPVDPEDSVTQPEDPRQTPEGDAFYNEEKDPWGEKDLSLYGFDGQVAMTPHIPTELLEGSGFSKVALEKKLSDSNEGVVVTYRGIAPGDEVLAALEHMQIPEQAVFILPDGTAEPYSLDTVAEDPAKNYSINIFLDEAFNVMDVSNGWENATWQIQIHCFNNEIYSYSAEYILETE